MDEEYERTLSTLRYPGDIQVLWVQEPSDPLTFTAETRVLMSSLAPEDILIVRWIDSLGSSENECIDRVLTLLKRGVEVRTLMLNLTLNPNEGLLVAQKRLESSVRLVHAFQRATNAMSSNSLRPAPDLKRRLPLAARSALSLPEPAHTAG